ncbi:MAG: glycosyltransferase [Phycisphaerales bacterium]|nr:glycosyltransferase [Phycisphaerales bacterium]
MALAFTHKPPMTIEAPSLEAFHAFDPAARRAPAPHMVAHVTWSLVAGGAETYALSIASHLDPRKFRSAFCAVDQGGALEAEVRRRGFPCEILARPPGIHPGLAWRLYRLFRRWDVRIVHTHHFNQLLYSVLGAKLAGARIIHTEHSVEVYKRRHLRIALRLLSLLCDKVVVIGDDGRRTLRNSVGIPKRKLRLIRAGVSLDHHRESCAQARAALGLGEAEKVASIVARLSPEKNHRLLLSAFAIVSHRFPEARLLIVGDGTERSGLKHEISRLGLEGRVRMLGVRRDVHRILAASDLFVLSSDREGLPIAVLEAMAAGRPVLATAVGDIPTVVRDGVNGRLVPPRDAPTLAAAMIELLADPERSAAMGARGRFHVEETYDVKQMASTFQAIYRGDREAV